MRFAMSEYHPALSRAMRALLLTACFALALNTFAADPAKVLRVAMPSAETTFDPQYESDSVTNTMMEMIFEPLLEYDYLARPATLIPRTAKALPAQSADGRVFTIEVKPGIFFTDHPAFKGKPRELVAQDYVYAFKRMLDPKVRSNWYFLVDNKFEGGAALRQAAQASGRFDYDAPWPGVSATGRYTLQFKLTQPDFGFPMQLALTSTSAITREVVEQHSNEVGVHPVGTGPYALAQWRRSSQVVLVANPAYRQDHWHSSPPTNDKDREITRAMQGKRIPQIRRIEVNIIPENQPRWLAFLNGELDYVLDVPEEYASFALPGGKLSAQLARQGYHTMPYEVAWLTNTIFNMRDPLVGGVSPEKVALRRAMAHGYRIDDEVNIFYKGQAVYANSPLLPSLAGYTEDANPIVYEPARAKALLDLFGYIDHDGDGYREQPDGKPLEIDYASEPTLRARQQNEIWKRSMDAIGIKLVFRTVAPLPELRKKAKAGQLQMWTYGWIADYPDGENIFQLLTTKSIGSVNYANFSHSEFDALYEKAKTLPHGDERNAIYAKLTKMVFALAPWRVNTYRRPTVMLQPWVKGYKKHPFSHQPWHMLDVEVERKRPG